MGHTGTNIERSPYYGALQSMVDSLFDGLEETAPDRKDGTFPAAGASSANAAPHPVIANADSAPAGNDATLSAADAFGVSERTASLLGLSALMAEAAGDATQTSSEPKPPAGPTIRRLDAVLAAEAADLPDDLVRIVKLLPPGDYTRERLCTQLNSAIAGHAWGQVYGTVE